MPVNRLNTATSERGEYPIPVIRKVLYILAGAAASGTIGAVWLLLFRPLLSAPPPSSPALSILEYLVVGAVAGLLICYLFKRELFIPPETPRSPESPTDADKEEEDPQFEALISRLNHKLKNSLFIIRGQAENFLRRDREGPDAAGFERIIEYVDRINEELELISDLAKTGTGPEQGDGQESAPSSSEDESLEE